MDFWIKLSKKKNKYKKNKVKYLDLKNKSNEFITNAKLKIKG